MYGRKINTKNTKRFKKKRNILKFHHNNKNFNKENFYRQAINYARRTNRHKNFKCFSFYFCVKKMLNFMRSPHHITLLNLKYKLFIFTPSSYKKYRVTAMQIIMLKNGFFNTNKTEKKRTTILIEVCVTKTHNSRAHHHH